MAYFIEALGMTDDIHYQIKRHHPFVGFMWRTKMIKNMFNFASNKLMIPVALQNTVFDDLCNVSWLHFCKLIFEIGCTISAFEYFVDLNLQTSFVSIVTSALIYIVIAALNMKCHFRCLTHYTVLLYLEMQQRKMS